MPKRKVGVGETTSSLAKKKGFFWRTIWEHAENASLRAKRKDPNVLYETDEIFIPERETKTVSKGTEAQHVFRRKGEPSKIKMQMLQLGKPRADEDYILDVDGKQTNGKTDADGRLEHFIPGDAKSGKLIFKGGKEVHHLRLGNLDPLDQISGVQQRLNNLGYNCGGEMGKFGEKTREALKKFQAENKLDESGEPDAATKAKLEELAK
jgi:N-acetylmuramoyl-L-alanine amidase